jgi:hypothetical protein
MAVAKFEIASSAAYAGGRVFGEVGPFEYIEGVVRFVVDPRHPDNAKIVDLSLVRTEADGNVHFSAEFAVLKPVRDLPRARLLYEVLNVVGRPSLTIIIVALPMRCQMANPILAMGF